MPRFTVLRDGRVERSLTLLIDEISIGRAPGAHLELPQPSVSRRHARIRREGSAFVVEDLGSMNGVLVGGRRIRRHELRRGDLVEIEDYGILFEPDDETYEAGLRQPEVTRGGAGAFNMTYVSAGGLGSASRVGRSAR